MTPGGAYMINFINKIAVVAPGVLCYVSSAI